MSTMAATKQGRRPRGREPGPGAFADQLPFELGQRREDAEHEAAGRRGGVDLRALPVSTSRPTPRGDRSCTVGVDQVGAGAAEAIELPVQSARTQLSNPGWSSRAPDAQSWQTWTAATPSTCSASRCRSSDWEAVRLRDASVADQHVS